MTRIITAILLTILFISCKEETKPQAEDPKEEVKQVSFPPSAYAVPADSTIILGKTTYNLHFEQKVRPGNFVMTTITGDSGVELHIYPDYELVFSLAEEDKMKQELRIVKDSLVKDITREFLDHAILDKLTFEFTEPESRNFVFSFIVTKPEEDFSYSYWLFLNPGGYHLEIQEEE